MIRGGEGNGGRALAPAIAKRVALAAGISLFCAISSMAGDGRVPTQGADPSCADDSGDIYVDCGNGTVTDNRTGLVWLQDATCLDVMTWQAAASTVAGFSDVPDALDEYCSDSSCDCGLSDGSRPGDWRLPTFAEWQEMVAAAVALGCTGVSGPAITADNGLGCWNESDALCVFAGTSCSFTGVENAGYWSATIDVGNTGNAWDVSLNTGTVFLSPKTTLDYLWPVRGGQ